jgi:hypothetical protein
MWSNLIASDPAPNAIQWIILTRLFYWCNSHGSIPAYSFAGSVHSSPFAIYSRTIEQMGGIKGHAPPLPPASASVEALAAENPTLIRELESLDPVRTAIAAGSLLTRPQLPANCHRLEALVHLAMAYCQGRRAPTSAFIKRAFETLGRGYCGRMEDPAEDLFSTLVSTAQGNFTIFEGIREANGFHLQRIVNIIDGMPRQEPFGSIRRSVESLLVLGNAIATREGIKPNVLGEENPLSSVPDGVCDALWRHRKALCLTRDEIEALNIDPESIQPFGFSVEQRSELAGQILGHTDLERRPILFDRDWTYVLLPTAIGTAITRFVIDSISSTGMIPNFERALAREYSKLIASMPIVGGVSDAQIPLQQFSGGYIGTALAEVDAGRVLHLVVWVDNLDNFNEAGLSGVNPDPLPVSRMIAEHIEQASKHAQSLPGFRDAITLVVTCGVGRSLVFGIGDLPDNWRLQHISGHELETLSWTEDFSSISLWRLLDSVDALAKLDVNLMNVNGLPNLVAWSRELNGHIVPHGQLPDGFRPAGSHGLIVVRQNGIRSLRYEMRTRLDPRRALDGTGNWVRVRKFDDSVFEDDIQAPLYASEDDIIRGKLRAAYISAERSWWIELVKANQEDRGSAYEHFKMLCCWLRRAAPVLEDAYGELPRTPISLEFEFEKMVGVSAEMPDVVSSEELRSAIQIQVDVASASVKFRIGDTFEDALAQPENVAERSLVEAIVHAASRLGAQSENDPQSRELVNLICPTPHARWQHRIQAHDFRDYAASANPHRPPLLIDSMDDAFNRIGLGLRGSGTAGEVTGSLECKRCLNVAVASLLDQLCAYLKQFERQALVTAVMMNHEAAAIDRERWKRTAQANLALHNNSPQTIQTIVRHIGEVNACCLASRILAEAAICECPPGSGNSPGSLDLSRLMALVMLAHHLGGWSDAVHWGAMEARVRITPLGDIHMNQSFMKSVYEPFGQVGGESDVKQAVENYTDLYGSPPVIQTVADLLEPEFLAAWQAEYILTIDQFRTLLDELDRLGLKPPRLLYELRRSELVKTTVNRATVTAESAAAALDAITSRPRNAWRTAEPGTSEKDWYPSRFRRRLSLIRRPLIQIEDGEDPRIIVLPAMLRENLFATMRGFHRGEIPDSQARSSEMRKWIGHANNVQRTKFNSTVATKMRDLGWHVDHEVKLTKLLRRALDRDYGDIDVLAWRSDSPRVMAMECKDLHYHKTIGEVAEQLSDFRGQIRHDGKPDHLKKHLDRIDILNCYKAELARTLGLSGDIQIEGHLVFKNFVPMRFAWDHMKTRMRLSLFDELDNLSSR